jgi:hypothetical protein
MEVRSMFKGIKHALGVGSADEYYARALELLAAGPAEDRRADAIRSFETAAEKADGRADLRARAQASAALHGFILEGGLEHLRVLQARMPIAVWIERPGDPTDRVMAEPLVAEIGGRLKAAEAAQSSGDLEVAAHEAAAAAFGRCLDHRLVTYPYHHTADPHVRTGRERSQFHTGVALLSAARRQLARDPDGAAATLSRALNAFAACGDAGHQQRCLDELRAVKTRRTCWVCQREFPGEGFYYDRVKAFVTPFVRAHLEAGGEDASSVEIERGELVLCRICQSIVKHEAARQIDERLPALEARLAARMETKMMEALAALQQSLR